ncbi:MAG: hypothetical protein GY792_31075 [Gammaproteobacteria bacterium]|nr:hypothetical protein [Gammaproteobacteria bacterium]
MKSILHAAIGLFLITASAQADLYVYPQKGQSTEQTDKDKHECYKWSKDKTGFDPMAAPKATTPAPKVEEKKGGAVKGAAVGAVGGKVFGSSSKTTKKSAAAGAVIGGAKQSSDNKKQQQAKKDWEQKEASKYAARRNEYNRAYGACLEGRGYSVK